MADPQVNTDSRQTARSTRWPKGGGLLHERPFPPQKSQAACLLSGILSPTCCPSKPSISNFPVTVSGPEQRGLLLFLLSPPYPSSASSRILKAEAGCPPFHWVFVITGAYLWFHLCSVHNIICQDARSYQFERYVPCCASSVP